MKHYLQATLILTFLLLVSCNTGDGYASQSTVDAPPVVAPHEWFTSHGGSGEEAHGHYILAADDGGYLQIGETGFIPDTAKIIVTKVDSAGALLWSREFGTAGHNLGNSLIETPSAYVVVGAIDEDSTLIRLDKSTGETLTSQTNDHGRSDAYEHVAVTADGFVAAGYTHAQDRENTFFTEGRGFLAFLDGTGQLLSTVDVTAHIAQGYRVSTHNDDIFVAGIDEEASAYKLLKLDRSGAIQWAKAYGGADAEHHFGFDQNAIGEMCLTGHTLSGTVNWDTYTVKVDLDGDVVWQATHGNPRGFDPAYIHDEAWGVAATADGGCLVVAGTGDEYNAYSQCNLNGCSDRWQAYLLKLSVTGQLEWQKTFTNPNEPDTDWAGEDLTLTADGNVMIAVDNGQLGFLKVSAQASNSFWQYDQGSESWQLQTSVPTAAVLSTDGSISSQPVPLVMIATLLVITGAVWLSRKRLSAN